MRPLNAVGEINYARKSYPEALAAFQKASQIAPTNADIQYNLARVNFALGDTKAQAAAAESALAKGTQFPGETFYLLGDANQKLNNVAGAIEAYQKALNVKPNLYQAYHNLAELFRSENRFNDAINISKQGLIQFPSDGSFYSELGLYYSLAGRPDDAIQLSPNQPIGYTNLCRAYNETGNYDLAASACNSSLRLRPDDGETNFYLGNALVGQGKGVEATRAYTNAVRGLVETTGKNPNQSDGWYLLGNAYFADKQVDKAIDAYLKCLSISPKFLKARVNLGISYTRKKNRAAATEQYNLLLAADASLAARVKAEIDKM
jgi:tetratricopeptide (TPR) repeat protein